jgi:hypothetical protein
MGVEFKNFGDFSKKLKELEKGTDVDFPTLFNDEFMRTYTKFETIDDFFDKSPFEVESNEDFDKINEQELDEYVRNNSDFADWEDMRGKAGEEWLVKQLGL